MILKKLHYYSFPWIHYWVKYSCKTFSVFGTYAWIIFYIFHKSQSKESEKRLSPYKIMSIKVIFFKSSSYEDQNMSNVNMSALFSPYMNFSSRF